MENLLFIDDDLSILHTLRLVMQKEGYKLHFANNAATAKQVLKKHSIAVIIADKNLPGASGIEILKDAKQTSPASIRVMLSGDYDFGSTLKSIKNAGVYRYITKPFNGSLIKQTINNAIKQFKSDKPSSTQAMSTFLRYRKITVKSSELSPGMKLCNDLNSDSGLLIAKKGHMLNYRDLKNIKSHKMIDKIEVITPN